MNSPMMTPTRQRPISTFMMENRVGDVGGQDDFGQDIPAVPAQGTDQFDLVGIDLHKTLVEA